MIDNLDAKMGMVQRLLRQSDGSSDFTERHMGLNSPLSRNQLRTRNNGSAQRLNNANDGQEQRYNDRAHHHGHDYDHQRFDQ